MSDVEGKVARVAASELGSERVSNGREHMSQCGQRASFNISELSPYLFARDLKSARKIGWSANARIANREIS
jgi:hypothetical protein